MAEIREGINAPTMPAPAPPLHLPMSAKLLPALSDAALIAASSRAIFGRGQTYAAGGAVGALAPADAATPGVAATVEGTQPYAVQVWVDGDEVAGDCDCPNAADGWFCKHQVALALAWRAQLSGEAPAADEAARKKVAATVQRAQTVRDKRRALEEFLRGRPAAELAERLLDLAERDSAIARELQQWRQLSSAPQDVAGLKALVTQILAPGRGFLDWRETGTYVHRAQAVLPVLAAERARQPAQALVLGRHALQRVWAVLQQADDSNGEIGGLAQAIAHEWAAALQAAGPQPAAFGETWLALQQADPIGAFPEAEVEAALGEAALARYRTVLERQWREAKAADSARSRRRDHFNLPLAVLERLHLRQLEVQGDVDGMLAVHRQDLAEPYAWHCITTLLEAHGREREAFANAERACKTFPDDTRLQDDLLRCYERDGWVEEALALHRRRFEKQPGLERYHAALKAGVAAGREAGAWRDELLGVLVKAEAAALAARRRYGRQPWLREPEGDGPDVSLRVQVLASEACWDEALALTQPPKGCRGDVLLALSRMLPKARARDRARLLQRALEDELRGATSPYRRALDLVAEAAALLGVRERAAWLASLRAAYKAKRNFIAALPAA